MRNSAAPFSQPSLQTTYAWVTTSAIAVWLLMTACPASAAPSDVPLFLKQGASPNVLLNLSVEGPMGGAAYNDQADGVVCTGRSNVTIGTATNSYGTCYAETRSFLGYFDPNKCYTYSTANTRFEAAGATDANHRCTSQWSGNFLNWAGMTAIDMLIMQMSGGNRVVDTTSLTVIERARKHDNDDWYPYKLLSATYNVAPSTVTPFADATLVIYNTAFGLKVGTTRTGAHDSATEYAMQVKVCDTTQGLEANCIAYGSGTPYYKPEGLIQKYAEKMRFAVTSYTLDNSAERDGGVLRSNAKYVGPRAPDTSGNWVANTKKEWGTDGLLVNNPDGIDVSLGLNSGVINYLNQFSHAGYKSKDPAAELYYEGLRFFKNLGPTPEYSSGITRNSTDGRCGGFWFANSASEWEDPIQYRCQKNFIIGINDANPWLDKRLPGTFFTSDKIISYSPAKNVTLCNTTLTPVSKVWRTATGPCSNATAILDTTTAANCAAREYIINSCQVTANDYDEPSNPDSAINVTNLTHAIGEWESLHAAWPNTGTWSSVGSVSTTSGLNDSVGGSVGAAGDFSGDCSAKTVTSLGQVMGTCGWAPKQNSYYLAGLAHYANVTDLRPAINGTQNISTFFIDTQEYSSNPLDGPKNMLWLAGKYGGFIDANNNQRPDLTSEWDSDGDGTPDNYVLATRPEKLAVGLASAFQDVLSRTSSSTSLVASSGRISTSTRIFQARFDSSNWTGRLQAFSLNADASLNATVWDTNTPGSIPADTARNIFTWDPVTRTGTQFLWSGTAGQILTAAQRTIIDSANSASTSSPILDYLRGARTNERSSTNLTGTMRGRSVLLGDIINSSPTYVGKVDFGYEALEATKGGSTYKAYRTAALTPMLYAGANDGMLHAFNATNGSETFAFVPNASIAGGMHTLASLNYAHKSFVDGPSAFGHAYLGGQWKTVLVGSMGAGGKSLFALDVSDPSAFTSAGGRTKVLWEFDASVTGDLGFTLQQPLVVRLPNERWAAVVGNGYNSTSGVAKLLIVFLNPDLTDGWTLGSDYLLLSTNSDTGNGLSAPVALADPRATVTTIYAGDLKGNVWKFDVSSSTPSSWGSAFTSGSNNYPLFTAKNASDTAQAITAPFEIALHPRGGYLLYFGTGKYYEDGDQQNTQVQSFYAIWDKPSASRITYTGRSDVLHEIKILSESSTTGTRLTSADPTTDIYEGTGAKRGWYMDLVVEGGTAKGERVFSAPHLIDDRVVFVTAEPSSDPCQAGGDSWIMEVNRLMGGRPVQPVFDLDGDGDFDSNDQVVHTSSAAPTGTVTPAPPSGVKKEGILPGVTMVSGGGNPNRLHKLSNSSVDGAYSNTLNRGNATPRGSWRELR